MFFTAHVNANTFNNNDSCIEGNYALSPDGKLLYRQCKDTHGPDNKYSITNPRPSEFVGEVVTTKEFSRVGGLDVGRAVVAWSLDGKALYTSNNLIERWSVTQYNVELLSQGSPISNFKPNFFTTESQQSTGWVGSSAVPVVDGLMSDLGIIPVIHTHAADAQKYVLTGGGNYQYNEEADERQLIVSKERIVFEKPKSDDVKVRQWLHDPYGKPLLNLLYSATKKTLSVNLLTHSQWSAKVK